MLERVQEVDELVQEHESGQQGAYEGGDQDLEEMGMYDSGVETDELEGEEVKEKDEDEEESECSDEDDDMVINDVDEAFDRVTYVPSDGDEEDDDEVSIDDEMDESAEDDEIEDEDEDEDEDEEEEESCCSVTVEQGSDQAVSETKKAELKEKKKA